MGKDLETIVIGGTSYEFEKPDQLPDERLKDYNHRVREEKSLFIRSILEQQKSGFQTGAGATDADALQRMLGFRRKSTVSSILELVSPQPRRTKTQKYPQSK